MSTTDTGRVVDTTDSAGPVVPVAGPSITQLEIDAVTGAVRDGWFERAGHHQAAFESRFAARVGRLHAQALPSCTAAIHLALLALGVGPGDEVIVPESTWIATAAPVVYVGARPVFADVDPHSWCVDVAAVERLVTARTKAVIAVDLYGGMADLTALEALCRRRHLELIEDAAEAIGSRLGDRPAGSFGRVAVFSFHGSKTMTTGEGGMAVTDDGALAARMRFLADHGRRPGDVSFRNEEVAYKYKMSAMQAALGSAQLSRLDELVALKRRIFRWYDERLGDDQRVVLNEHRQGLFNSVWMSTVIVDPGVGLDKVELARRLAARGIATRPFFDPLSSLPAFRQGAADRSGDRPVARALARTGLNLPSALTLGEDDVERVCRALRAALDG